MIAPRGDAEKPSDAQIQRETLVAWTALAIALVALAYCVRHGTLLLYGDAVAHLHIARRVFDSITPGFRQLGSVWLPLPHILLLPFVWNMAWWQNGLAGACLSIPSYVLGCAGIYRLARMWLDMPAAIVVVAFYGLNPGLLYMATTAMTEPLFLAEMIWAVLLIVQYERALAEEALPPSEFLWLLSRREPFGQPASDQRWAGPGLRHFHPLRRVGVRRRRLALRNLAADHGARALLELERACGGRLGVVYRPAGCGSVVVVGLQRKAIWRSAGLYPWSLLGPRHRSQDHAARLVASSGLHNLRVSAVYFLKAAELGAAPLRWETVVLAQHAQARWRPLWAFRRRQFWPVLLLWLPLPFYAYSVAYGSVPIFIPIWRPFSWYNTRYGMELLPAFALFAGCLIPALLSRPPKLRRYAVLASLLLVVGNSVVLLRSRPLVFQEAFVNSRSRLAFETALAKALLGMPWQGLILMRVSAMSARCSKRASRFAAS
jgi:hypothetical protein